MVETKINSIYCLKHYKQKVLYNVYRPLKNVTLIFRFSSTLDFGCSKLHDSRSTNHMQLYSNWLPSTVRLLEKVRK